MNYEECKNCKWFEGVCYNLNRECILKQFNVYIETEGLKMGFSFGAENE